LPLIAANISARIAQLNLTASGYVSILFWNQQQAPVRLQAEPDSPQMIRVNLGISWRKGLRSSARRLARESGLSVNALAEALIARDLRSPESPLVILPARGTTKPRLR
jgi:hypothetical protein